MKRYRSLISEPTGMIVTHRQMRRFYREDLPGLGTMSFKDWLDMVLGVEYERVDA